MITALWKITLKTKEEVIETQIKKKSSPGERGGFLGT
jgi:hypothetical protein